VLGLVGVVLVVARKLTLGIGTPAGISLAVFALLGITVGTLYQKRFCAGVHLISGNVIQFTAAALATGGLAWALESGRIEWTGEFLFALGWLVVVLSLGAITLLYVLIRRGAASRVASLFYLTPPSTAIIAWALFGETLGPLAILGMVVAVTGVALVIVQR